LYLTIATTTSLPPSTYDRFDQIEEPQLIHFAGVLHEDNGLEHERVEYLVRPDFP
jgi:hypothetical protein